MNSPTLVNLYAPEMLLGLEQLSAQLGKKAPMNLKHEVPEPDIENPKERYNAKYVPRGGVNEISPLTSMKYSLSKQQIKLQGEYTKRLREAILANPDGQAPLKVTKYYCSGCDGLLFSEHDILNHVPVYTSSFTNQGLQFL